MAKRIKYGRRINKTPDEAKLKIKYTTLMSRPQTQEEFDKMVVDFKRDVELVKKDNPMYADID